MHAITCCRYCVAPKRHPGCHAKCPEYNKELAIHNREKDARKGELMNPVRQYKNEKLRARIHKDDLKQKRKGGSLQ